MRTVEIDSPGGRVSFDRPRVVRLAGLGVAAVALFLAYLRMSRSEPMNADAAGNAVQAWEMLHGNVLLHGWTVSDVPFYTTELIQYALIESVYGYRADVVHVAAAMTYTMLVLLAVWLARGRATGVEGLARMAIAALVIAVPLPGEGYHVLLLLPNHTGTGVPVLVTWLVLDRALVKGGNAGRWLPFAMVALLAWGQLGDPLVVFVAVLPLVVVGLWRALRARDWFGVDARLAAAGLASVVVTQLVLLAIRAAGGFAVHPPVAVFSPIAEWPAHLPIVGDSLAVLFHAKPWAETTVAGSLLAVLHLAVLAGVGIAVLAGAAQLLRFRRDRPGDLIAQLAATGILVNLSAYVVSTHGADTTSTRQAAVVLPLGAVLAARLFPARLLSGFALGRWPLRVVAAVAVLFAAQLTVQTRIAPVPAEHQDVADWLVEHNLTFGIGSYWSANNITLASGGRVTVAPITGYPEVVAFRWETRTDWYDPAQHDARFVIIESIRPGYGSVEGAIAQFGAPVERVDFPDAVLLRYDTNLLTNLAAECFPGRAARIADCPPLTPIPGF